MRGYELFELIQLGLGPEANRHRGVDAPARRDTAIAGGSYRSPGTLVDGFRAGDGDREVKGIVVVARASTEVLRRAAELGANLVISRQAFLGDSQDRPVSRPEPALAEKLALIERSGIAVLRLQDARTGADGRAITQALQRAIGLKSALNEAGLLDALIYRLPSTPLIDLVRRIKAATGSNAVRLIGDPGMPVQGLALATETSRPNALNPLIARADVNLLVAGEVHETETSAYVMDAMALGQQKAILLAGSIALEEPPARALAAWLKRQVSLPVTLLPSSPVLEDFG
ncbi:Nif3-like dinuclear metal center hexameric protein [Novosphingobium aquae]|uniref:Nif3-like dinuclear metal center hexameric protein n=1 Tax=Novosphingobium aquae TaxID=3133435 RepID=A0ABU8SAZ3_9SPHN